MILQTHENWELREPLFQAIDVPGTRRYAMVEIALNLPLFWLDAAVVAGGDDEPVLWHTFLLTSFEDVQAFLEVNKTTNHQIGFVPPRGDSGSHALTISTITEVYVGTAPDGSRSKLFVCADGRRFVEAFGLEEEALTDRTLVYTKAVPTPASGNAGSGGEEASDVGE